VIPIYHRRLRPAFTYWFSHRYTILFYSLLFTLLAAPFITLLHFHSNLLLGALLSANLATALAGFKSRQLSHVLLAFFSVMIFIRLVATSVDMQGVTTAATIATVLLGFFAAAEAVRVAMSSNKISTEHLYAALGAYLLFGFVFGVLHFAIEEGWPGAYGVPAGEPFTLHSGIYFSFVTQTTLGYGDIFPKIEVARALSIVQAIIGQLYLTVMVARLVSLYVTNPDDV
jgi:Ion channel